jgi:DNA-binding ferritin-like protein
MIRVDAHMEIRGCAAMNSHKKVQLPYHVANRMSQYGAHDSLLVAERMELVELLQEHLMTALDLRQYVNSLEARLRNVSFVDLRQLFHRIGEATRDCADFLSERIHDLGALAERSVMSVLYQNDADTWRNLNFAACIWHINARAETLTRFAPHARGFMDRAVVNGDYASLHLITDCIHQISQLVALIQINIPAEPTTPVGEHSTPCLHQVG